MGEQITVEQLIEKRIIMRLSRHDHVVDIVFVAKPLQHLELALVFLEEERVMQQSSVSISLSF